MSFYMITLCVLVKLTAIALVLHRFRAESLCIRNEEVKDGLCRELEGQSFA